MKRQIANEDELWQSVQQLPGIEPALLDFAGMPLLEQVRSIAGADLVVGKFAEATNLSVKLLMTSNAGMVSFYAGPLWLQVFMELR